MSVKIGFDLKIILRQGEVLSDQGKIIFKNTNIILVTGVPSGLGIDGRKIFLNINLVIVVIGAAHWVPPAF